MLAVEKRITSSLLVPSSLKKLAKLDQRNVFFAMGNSFRKHTSLPLPFPSSLDIGCAMSGLVPDARTLIDHGRVQTQQHWFTYDEQMLVKSAVQSIADLALGFGGKMVHTRAHASVFVGFLWCFVMRSYAFGLYVQAFVQSFVSSAKLNELPSSAQHLRSSSSCSPSCQARPFGVALLVGGWDENGPQL